MNQLLTYLSFLIVAGLFGPVLVARQDDPTDEAAQILQAQKDLAEQYRLLEQKLFSLHEYEKDNNPLRSKLLKLAFIESQENLTTERFEAIVRMFEASRLKDAEKDQQVALEQLQALLKLLESEDRGKRVRDEIKKNQQYLKEVQRLLRLQQGIRARAENGNDLKSLEDEESKIGERTEELKKELEADQQENESSSSPDSSDSDSDSDSTPKAEQAENGNPKSPDQEPSGNNSPAGDQNNESQESSQQESADPLQQKIEAATRRMNEAQQKMREAEREQSIEKMQDAERELEQAKKVLEEILRQLREEEVERTLATLEGRFRKMLERQIRINRKTGQLASVAADDRKTDFEIQTGKLGTEQNSIAIEAERALMLLREDGSSVAFPETVSQMRDDMRQVADRLTAANVGEITQEIEADIEQTLTYLVESLITTQQEMEKMKEQPPGQQQGGEPGEQSLVNQIAELKMLRGLQERIYKRHVRYSELLADPNDITGQAESDDLKAGLERLAKRQLKLTRVAQDIVSGKNK